MNLSEAKATSRLLHGLAGDTDLDPTAATAVIATLSFHAGAALEISRVLSPASLQAAVSRAATQERFCCGRDDVLPGAAERATFRTSFPTLYLLGGFLFGVMTVFLGFGLSTGRGWLLLGGFAAGAAAVAATRKASRITLQLFEKVLGHVSGQSPDRGASSNGSLRLMRRMKTWG